ncbi:MAG: hypothetical protein MK116_06815 [Phycisphaerales bacterium]|nr:hypothetical protein [Phycisphaerales bacterium]
MLTVLATTGSNQAAGEAAAIGMMAGFGVFCGVFVVMVAVTILLVWLIYDSAKAASPSHRTMEPGLVWLLLIPVFNAFWNFKALPAVSGSLAGTLRDQGKEPGDCGRGVGMIFSILVAIIVAIDIIASVMGHVAHPGSRYVSAVAELGAFEYVLFLVDLAALVTFILYVVQLRGAKTKILAGS